MVKAALYESLVSQQVLPEQEVHPGVPTPPLQAFDAADAVAELGEQLRDESEQPWLVQYTRVADHSEAI